MVIVYSGLAHNRSITGSVTSSHYRDVWRKRDLCDSQIHTWDCHRTHFDCNSRSPHAVDSSLMTERDSFSLSRKNTA